MTNVAHIITQTVLVYFILKKKFVVVQFQNLVSDTLQYYLLNTLVNIH